jgi:hypothetical protein
MIVLLYILGYLIIAYGVAKIAFMIDGSLESSKEASVVLGISWIVSIPFIILALVAMSIWYVILESGKKLL